MHHCHSIHFPEPRFIRRTAGTHPIGACHYPEWFADPDSDLGSILIPARHFGSKHDYGDLIIGATFANVFPDCQTPVIAVRIGVLNARIATMRMGELTFDLARRPLIGTIHILPET
jgi:hypothetical protein